VHTTSHGRGTTRRERAGVWGDCFVLCGEESEEKKKQIYEEDNTVRG
jgi:hypothetical protein